MGKAELCHTLNAVGVVCKAKIRFPSFLMKVNVKNLEFMLWEWLIHDRILIV